VLGALFFGRLTDRLGRKKLFLTTLAVYMLATLATAFAPDYAWFAVCRWATGFGIGGEYAAINSAIDELIPARLRGRVNLSINGSFWLGAALGAALSLVLLDPRVLGPALGWRVCFLLGATFAGVILLVRRHVPESPRWLLSHGRPEEAEAVVGQIEAEIEERAGTLSHATKTTDYAKGRGPSLGRCCAGAADRLPPAQPGGPRADGGAGVFLQCDLLYLRARPQPLLRRS
jgi:MFS family permease